MTPTTTGWISISQRLARISTLICFLAGGFAAEAGDLSVFGVGVDSPASVNPSELYRFNELGPMEQRWDIPETQFGGALATIDSTLLVAELFGAINRYDFDGNFQGEFADVSGLAGPGRGGPQTLETDATGSVYTAFGGFASSPRTSFRLDSAGNVTGTFSHPNLVFPRGIDASANGNVFIVNSAAVGVGNRLFKFGADGRFIADFAIPQTVNPSDVAIDEATQELFLSDEFDQSIHIYDISSGAPIFSRSIPTPGSAIDVFIEPLSGRIFGTYVVLETDEIGVFFRHVGFEVLRDGTVVSLYVENAEPREQSVRAIVAVASGAHVVDIDIKPESFRNSINPYSRGVIPVAILGGETLDVADVDVTTLAFGPNGASIAHLNGHEEDANLDGLMDLVLHFRTQETGIVCGDESVTLTGETLDGQPFEGTDSIQTVGCRVSRWPAIWMKDQDRLDKPRSDGPVNIKRD